jgi:hypothetical protein
MSPRFFGPRVGAMIPDTKILPRGATREYMLSSCTSTVIRNWAPRLQQGIRDRFSRDWLVWYSALVIRSVVLGSHD